MINHFYVFSIMLLTSCNFAAEFGGGTLGSGGGIIETKCSNQELKKMLNEFYQNNFIYHPPKEYLKYNSEHENNYNFLVSWTFYFPEEQQMVWVTLVERADDVGRICNRSAFNFEENIWVNLTQASNYQKDKLNNLLRTKVLSQILCFP